MLHLCCPVCGTRAKYCALFSFTFFSHRNKSCSTLRPSTLSSVHTLPPPHRDCSSFSRSSLPPPPPLLPLPIAIVPIAPLPPLLPSLHFLPSPPPSYPYRLFLFLLSPLPPLPFLPAHSWKNHCCGYSRIHCGVVLSNQKESCLIVM